MMKLTHFVEILCIASLVCGQSRSTSNVETNIGDLYENADKNQNHNSEDIRDEFDWNLFQTISNENYDNIVISPFSLKFSMALLYEASAGITEKEIGAILKFPAKNETRKIFTRALTSLHEANKNYILNFGSRIYVDSTINVNQKYGSTAYFYKTQIQKIDVSDAGKTANDANDWIKKLTEGNIPNLVQEDDLKNAVVVLLNAIYFKGTWEYQFLTNETKNDVFHLTSVKQISTKFMTQTQNFKYYDSENLDARILRLPYKGNKYAMYIIVPKSYNGLSNLISSTTSSQIARQMLLIESTNVKVKMPLFKFDYLTKFVPILQEMGIRDLFEVSASLPGIAHGVELKTKLMVSNILQKAGIDVNELGSTAYAATEVTLVNKFGTDDNVEEFIVDRPFLFFIEDETTQQTLFLGKIENPSGGKATEISINPSQPAITRPQSAEFAPSKPSSPAASPQNKNQPRVQNYYGSNGWNRAQERNLG